MSARRAMPRWHRPARWSREHAVGPDGGPEVVLFVDTFSRYFEPENIKAALAVLELAGYGVHLPAPLCCGRTFLSVGLVDEARKEAERSIATLAPFVARGIPVVGEPRLHARFRDRSRRWSKRRCARARLTRAAPGFRRARRERALKLPLKPVARRAISRPAMEIVPAMGAVEAVLKLVPGLAVETVESSCCGMAGAFAATPARSMCRCRWRAVAAARGAQGRRRYAHRGRQHLMPTSDRRGGRTRGAPSPVWPGLSA
jgi:hypothetical protein